MDATGLTEFGEGLRVAEAERQVLVFGYAFLALRR